MEECDNIACVLIVNRFRNIKLQLLCAECEKMEECDDIVCVYWG